jgi:glycosyltransferase involved in cell wall biosynthesis
MRVLMTADAVGGVWTYAVELATALRERDVDVTIAVLGPPPSDAQREQWRDLVELDGLLEWQDEPWDDVERSGRRLVGLADDVRPDVVHLNGYAHAALEWPAAVLVAAHSCVLSWWEAVRGEPAPAEWERYRRSVRAGLLAADAVVAPTAAMLAALRRLYRLPSGSGAVISNGLRDRFAPERAKEHVVLAAGRLWDEAKGLLALDAAAAEIGWPVEVAGVGAGASSARLLGRLDPRAMRKRMETAAIFAHPARYEPFGLAPLEAGLARCALVLGDLASLHEVWEDAAVYVPPGDGEALAAALRALIADPALRHEMADRAQRRARGYSADAMADAYLAAYARLRAQEALPA